MHALVLIHVHQSAHKIHSAWLNQFQRYDWVKIKKKRVT